MKKFKSCAMTATEGRDKGVTMARWKNGGVVVGLLDAFQVHWIGTSFLYGNAMLPAIYH